MANNFLQRGIQTVSNYMFPTPDNRIKTGVTGKGDPVKDLRNFISPVQLQRLRQDIAMWREAVREAELPYYPHRVRMQQMYVDTILEGHTLACVKKRKDLTLLRQWDFTNEKGQVNKDIKKQLDKQWFALFLEYALEARFFGYSLITLGDLVNSEFPDLGIVRRWHVSPDRLNVVSMIRAISGDNFMEEPYSQWHVWVPTPSDVGISPVGYGELYAVARYEILARNLLGQNSDAAELYGAPMIWAKTQKTEEAERAELERAIASRGGAGYMLTDPTDELETFESKGNGAGFKIYPDLELRIEKKVSKLLLGHADAIDSVPGKLGSSGEKSPSEAALLDKQTSDGAFLENVVNTVLMPKLEALGFKFDPNYPFRFNNNAEKNEQRQNDDKNMAATAAWVKQFSDAGLSVDPAEIEKRTGLKLSLKPVAMPMFNKYSERVKNSLKELYNH